MRVIAVKANPNKLAQGFVKLQTMVAVTSADGRPEQVGGEIVEFWTPEIDKVLPLNGKDVPADWKVDVENKRLLPPKPGGGGYRQSKEAFDREAESRERWQVIEEDRKDRRTAVMTAFEWLGPGGEIATVEQVVGAALRVSSSIYDWLRESAPPQPGAAAGGRVDQASSASRASSGPGSGAPAAPDSSRDQLDRPGSSSEGTAGIEGEAVSEPSGSTSEPGEDPFSPPRGQGTKPSLGSDHPGPPHYALDPSACDHLRTTGTKGLLSPRKSPRGPVCPRCGLSYVAITEGTTADLGRPA